MYLPALIERVGIFQGLGGWPSRTDGQQPQYLGHALFRATSTLVELQRIHAGEELCRRQFDRVRDELELRHDRIAFWSPTVVAVLGSFSSALASVRALQDLLPRLIGQTVGVGGVPHSMNDLNRLRRSDLPRRCIELVEEYWRESGSLIKEYRDLDVHHWSVAKDIYLKLSDPVRVLVLLPDNPGDPSRRSHTFEREVDGISMLQKGVQALDRLTHDVCAELGGSPGRPSLTMSLEQFGPLLKGVSQTVGVVVDDESGAKGVIIGQNPERRVTIRQYVVATE